MLRSRPLEDVVGQFPRRPGEDRLGLGAEGGQLLGLISRERPGMAHPFDRAIEAPPRFFAMPQAVMGHGLEEKVKPIKLTLPGLQALLEGRHRLGIYLRQSRRPLPSPRQSKPLPETRRSRPPAELDETNSSRHKPV